MTPSPPDTGQVMLAQVYLVTLLSYCSVAAAAHGGDLNETSRT